jgi:hypothetical protein
MDPLKIAVVALFIPLLDSPQSRVREDATKALSKIGAVTDLRQQLELAEVGRSNEVKRRLLIVANEYEWHPKYAPALMYFSSNHPGWKDAQGDPDFRQMSIEGSSSYIRTMYNAGYTREMVMKVVNEAGRKQDEAADELVKRHLAEKKVTEEYLKKWEKEKKYWKMTDP